MAVAACEHLAQLLAGTEQARGNRTLGHAQHVGDLVIAIATDDLQQQGLTVRLWQSANRVAHHFGIAFHLGTDAVGTQGIEFDIAVIRLDALEAAGILTPQCGEQPTFDGFRIAQLGQGAPSAKKCVLNQIIGGQGFASRLMEEVREKRGLTYGIGTYLAPMDLAETWQGSFASANEKVAEAVAVVRAEWARIAAEGASDAEIAAAKTYLTGSYPLRFDGNGPIATILVGMQLDGLPVDYLVNRNSYVEAVTAEDIKRVASRLMDGGKLRFVVVGQPKGLEPDD